MKVEAGRCEADRNILPYWTRSSKALFSRFNQNDYHFSTQVSVVKSTFGNNHHDDDVKKCFCPAAITSRTLCWAPTAASLDTEASSTGSLFFWSVSPFYFSLFRINCFFINMFTCIFNCDVFQVLTHAHLFLENFIQWVLMESFPLNNKYSSLTFIYSIYLKDFMV